MRKFLFLVFVLGSSIFALAQNSQAPEKKDGAIITFDKKTHDFGDIVQGDKVEHTFYFTNTGNEPLIITNVQVTCGCTTPKGWPREPIPPGARGELTVGFSSSGKIGRQQKPVTVISNAVNTDGNQITFSTNILPSAVSQPQR
jgi:hypothetical protein